MGAPIDICLHDGVEDASDCIFALNENLILAEVLNRTATPEEKDEAKRMWDALPEWRKRDIEDEVEFDLL